MTTRTTIATTHAPAAIGTYSQAVRVGQWLFLSGQIGLDPTTMQLATELDGEIRQAFKNLAAVAAAGGASLAETVKLTLYVTDMSSFALVNQLMAEFFDTPYPARATVEVKGLPRGARFEADAIIALP